MTARRPTLTQVFPDPLTQQWPSTSNPVFCECQQLYALVSLCCCVSGAHLLVLHEGPSTNILTAMPRGPKYVDFKISRWTSPDDLASFLVRANKAAGVVTGGRWDSKRDAHGAGPILTDTPYSPRSVHAATTSPAPAGAARASTSDTRRVVVVCVRGLAAASPEVLGLLMDALVFGCVAQPRGRRNHDAANLPRRSTSSAPPAEHATTTTTAKTTTMDDGAAGDGETDAARKARAAAAARRHEHTVVIPCVRIIAFCDAQSYAVVLPETFRAAFDLSLFMSRVAMESAAVLQSGDSSKSNVVHRANMLEIANSSDGESLADTVTCSALVTRYLRHLLLVMRGSTFNMDSFATYAVRKLNRFVHLLRVITILFEPDDADQMPFRNRWAPRLRYPTHSRFLSSEATTAASRELGDDVFDDSDDSENDTLAAAAGGRPRGTYGARRKKPPTSYAHLVISSATVVCLFGSLVCHLPSVSRYTVPHPDVIEAARPVLKVLSTGRSALGMAFVPTKQVDGVDAPGFWDARLVTQSGMLLRHGTAYPTVVRALGRCGGATGLPSDLTGSTNTTANINNNSWPTQALAPADQDNPLLGSGPLYGSMRAAVNNHLFHTSFAQSPEDLMVHLNRHIPHAAPLASRARMLPHGLGRTSLLADRQIHSAVATWRRNTAQSTASAGGPGDASPSPPPGMSLGETLSGDEAAGRMVRSQDLGTAVGLSDDANETPTWDALHYNEVRELVRAVIIARSAPAPG